MSQSQISDIDMVENMETSEVFWDASLQAVSPRPISQNCDNLDQLMLLVSNTLVKSIESDIQMWDSSEIQEDPGNLGESETEEYSLTIINSDSEASTLTTLDNSQSPSPRCMGSPNSLLAPTEICRPLLSVAKRSRSTVDMDHALFRVRNVVGARRNKRADKKACCPYCPKKYNFKSWPGFRGRVRVCGKFC
jgi:hypothetical protein